MSLYSLLGWDQALIALRMPFAVPNDRLFAGPAALRFIKEKSSLR